MSGELQKLIGVIKQVEPKMVRQLNSRATAASQALRNAELEVLRGGRGGKTYNKPGTGRVKYNKRKKTAKIIYKTYTASAPGEPPAVRTNTLRSSFKPISRPIGNGALAAIETNVPYAGYMEDGTPGGMIAPRPFGDKIIEKAEPKITQIFSQPYNI